MGTNFGNLPCMNNCIHTQTICFEMPGPYLGSICSEGFVTTVNCGYEPTAPFALLWLDTYTQLCLDETENLNHKLSISRPVALRNHAFKCNAEPLHTD